ncbi:hypothetical protein [Clostridium carboxidivorans]|uniref:hypothetical protein n=2 Tax=Clostridium carboxidivorans TaxID=217159 RepID=UPI0012E27280|nr:hypothetical protein [Clostridium carboxidivorans]
MRNHAGSNPVTRTMKHVKLMDDYILNIYLKNIIKEFSEKRLYWINYMSSLTVATSDVSKINNASGNYFVIFRNAQ